MELGLIKLNDKLNDINANLHANLIYENKLADISDIEDFCLEGNAKITFPNGCMRLENEISQEFGQKANYVLWCQQDFPEDVYIEWDFKPVKEPGLCILFFAAKGKNGKDIFDDSLSKRTGEYIQYHHGDIDAFHVSYYRRKEADERAFHTCNLRKSYGFHLVAQGGDPIPDADEVKDFYKIGVLKYQNIVKFYINDLEIFSFEDDGKSYGAILNGGKIGFRQLAPLVAEYANLRVYQVKK